MTRKHYILIFLFFVMLLTFNFPVLHIFNKAALQWGIPVLYLYVFGVWGLVISALVLLVEYRAYLKKKVAN